MFVVEGTRRALAPPAPVGPWAVLRVGGEATSLKLSGGLASDLGGGRNGSAGTGGVPVPQARKASGTKT